MVHDGLGPVDHFIFELIKRHDFVDQSHLERFLGRILAAHEPDFTRFLLSDAAGEIARPEPCIEGTDAGPGLSEHGILARNRQVADDLKHMAAADRKAVHHGDDGFGERTDLFLHVEHIEPRHTCGVNVASDPFDMHVAPGAEGLVAGTGENYYADIVSLAADDQRFRHLRNSGRRKSVAHLRAVDGDLGDAFEVFKENV